ncbi:S8 family peptidase [Marinospirillum insulare]|uniref:Peptidase S8/S53 domain-containing protein n=1 Tax=Marinospirillum insulare TaxID=217169 RepID=A0ABQ5ZYJ0_9GAMM|nr:S8 family serine peptidase [Marinospirillum insulare]GLR64373.1 hypothetical protein GCM10007878_18110 [Marinospirillum insulare]
MRIWLFVLLLLPFNSLFAEGVIVTWKKGYSQQSLELPQTSTQKSTLVFGKKIFNTKTKEIYLYQVPNRQQRLKLIQKLMLKPNVISVELDAAVEIQADSQLPAHFQQLDLVTINEYVEQYACHDIPIAVLDTGIASNHSTLQFINFISHKNYIDNTASAEDDNGHGTHVAGLIGASRQQLNDPSEVVAGLCYSASLHNYKVIEQDGFGSVSGVIEALESILDSGREAIPLINLSLTTNSSFSLRTAINELGKQGQFVVVAAGNSGLQLDTSPSYPAAYSKDFSNVISVANVNSGGFLADSSNFGYQLVDFSAPGEKLLSTWLMTDTEDGYAVSSGTSMSTPLVTATLAALMQKYQHFNLPPEAFRAAIINSLNYSDALQGKLKYAGILSTGNSLSLTPEQLFKPAWFNYKWQEDVDAIYISGYKMDEVVGVNFHNLKDLKPVKELAFSYKPEMEAVLVILPESWRDGSLEFITDSHELKPLDFTLMVANSLPEKSGYCVGSHCEVKWENLSLAITRLDGNNQPWFLSTQQYQDQTALVISGSNLSGIWDLKFSGAPRLQVLGMQAVNALGEVKELTTANGYLVHSETNVSWLVEEPEKWSSLAAPLQQLWLLPQVSTSAEISSSSNSCYIASQVYGDVYAPEVMVLRQFRDDVLMHSELGKKLTAFYYKHSPALALWIADKPKLQGLVRWCLDFLVKILR